MCRALSIGLRSLPTVRYFAHLSFTLIHFLLSQFSSYLDRQRRDEKVRSVAFQRTIMLIAIRSRHRAISLHLDHTEQHCYACCSVATYRFPTQLAPFEPPF